MTTDAFQVVNMNAGDQQKSYQWYQKQVQGLGITSNYGNQLMRNKKLVKTIVPGQMYLFLYDPKHKDKLPYYDTLPLVLPFSLLPDGFLGINLHYLPYLARFKLLGELNKIVINQNTPERTRIRLSWELLNSSSKYLAATACVKHYLNDHIKTNFLKIDFNDWKTAAMLPIERFKGASKEKIWQETSKGYR